MFLISYHETITARQDRVLSRENIEDSLELLLVIRLCMTNALSDSSSMIAVILQDTVLIGTLFYNSSGIFYAKSYF